MEDGGGGRGERDSKKGRSMLRPYGPVRTSGLTEFDAY
jgi:hypothetical protein